MVLGNMTTIETQDLQEEKEIQNSFHNLPIEKERY